MARTVWVKDGERFYRLDRDDLEAVAERLPDGGWEGDLTIGNFHTFATAATLTSIKGWVARQIKEHS